MSKMEELLELEETIAPELLEHMAEADMQKLSVQEQQRVEQMVLQKITALQADSAAKQKSDTVLFMTEQAMQPAEQHRKKQNKLRFRLGKRRWIGAVAACALLFSLSTAAVATLSTDERLLKLLHADSQSQIAQMNEMATPLGISDTVDGYTLTLQEAINDQHHLWLLLDLTAPEGVVLDAERLYFRKSWLHFEKMGSHGYTTYTLPDENPTDNQVSFMMEINTRRTVTNNPITLEKGDLGLSNWADGEEQWTQLSKGSWKFEFVVPDNDTTISMWQWKVLEHGDKNFLLTKMEVSPLSITLKTRRLEWDIYAMLREEPVQVYLKSGEMIELSSNSSGGGGLVMDFSYTMPEPIDLAEIDHVVFCGETLNW